MEVENVCLMTKERLRDANAEFQERIIGKIEFWSGKIRKREAKLKELKALLAKAKTEEEKRDLLDDIQWELRLIRQNKEARHEKACLIGLGDRFPPPADA